MRILKTLKGTNGTRLVSCWLDHENMAVLVRAWTLTKHPLRLHRTRPQTDKCHRWTSPSVLSLRSPLLLRRQKKTRDACLMYKFVKAEIMHICLCNVTMRTQVHLHSAITLNNPQRNCLLHPFPLSPPLFSTLSYSLPPRLSSITLKSLLIFLESRFYFIALIFSRCECDDSLAAVWVLASGLWRLRDPAGAYHAS